MIVKIEIDTREELTTEDEAILRAFLGESPAAAAEAPKADTGGPAKKASPAKKAAASQPSEPASEPEEPESTPADTDLRDAAVARASELLSSGQRDRVMAALKETGAGRVSEVPDSGLQAFLDAITD